MHFFLQKVCRGKFITTEVINKLKGDFYIRLCNDLLVNKMDTDCTDVMRLFYLASISNIGLSLI